MKLNYGSGESKLEGFINIDIEEKTKPDVICDLRKEPLPYESETVDLIHCIHNIEHIEKKWWNAVFFEFARVLKLGGKLYLAYPEFERCAVNFIENYRGMRNFWEATLYGRQHYPGDYHVVPMRTVEVLEYLRGFGFTNIKCGPEPEPDEHNTFVIAEKGFLPKTREDVLRAEIFKIRELRHDLRRNQR